MQGNLILLIFPISLLMPWFELVDAQLQTFSQERADKMLLCSGEEPRQILATGEAPDLVHIEDFPVAPCLPVATFLEKMQLQAGPKDSMAEHTSQYGNVVFCDQHKDFKSSKEPFDILEELIFDPTFYGLQPISSNEIGIHILNETRDMSVKILSHPGSRPEKCNLPLETGPCKAAFSHFYYDTKTRRCQAFMYGGCQGNENKFESPLDCIWECERFDLPPPKCRTPADKGEGQLFFKRYFYDFNNKLCRTFIYKGKGGNKNNFHTKKECFEQCAQFEIMPIKCDLPQETGPCKASYPRYYYNSKSRRCEEFTYSGCRGNANNFQTAIDCIRGCESYGGW